MKTLNFDLTSQGIVNTVVKYEDNIVYLDGIIENRDFKTLKDLVEKETKISFNDHNGYSHLLPKFCYLQKRENLNGIDGVTSFQIINSQLGDFYHDRILIMGNEKEIGENPSLFYQRILNKKIERNTPFPFKSEWIEFFYNELVEMGNVEPLTVDSEIIKEGISVKLPNDNNMETLIGFSHNCYRWKAKHKRVPQIKELVYGILNVEDFNFKKWQSFVKDFGGQDKLKALDSNIRRGVISLFEVFEEKTNLLIEEFGQDIWWQTNLKPLKIAASSLGKKIVADKSIKNINLLNTTTQENKDEYKFSLIAHLDKFLEGDWTFNKIKQELDTMVYENVQEPEVARVCAKAKVTQHEFEIYQEWWQLSRKKRELAGRAIPTISGTIEGTDVSWEMCDAMDHNILVVGNETNCCQHPTSVGGACVDYMLKNPETSTIFRITERGKTIAQSFVWLEEDFTGSGSTLVMDNIEVKQSGGQIRDSIIACYKEYAEAAKRIAKTFKIKGISVGSGYSDINMDRIGIKLDRSHKVYATIPGSLGYSDASNQYLLVDYRLS